MKKCFYHRVLLGGVGIAQWGNTRRVRILFSIRQFSKNPRLRKDISYFLPNYKLKLSGNLSLFLFPLFTNVFNVLWNLNTVLDSFWRNCRFYYISFRLNLFSLTYERVLFILQQLTFAQTFVSNLPIFSAICTTLVISSVKSNSLPNQLIFSVCVLRGHWTVLNIRKNEISPESRF